jgi:hypothetical protein
VILSSRPLRFIGAVIGGWIGVRAAMLWPAAELVPDLVHAVAPAVAAEPATMARPAGRAREMAQLPGRRRPPAARRVSYASMSSPMREPLVLAAARRLDPPGFADEPVDPARPVTASWAFPGVDPPPVFRASHESRRWSGSAWAILRPDGRATPFASQLGGSQAGARIAYALGEARRVAVYARASTAIDAAQREAAVGIDWRPTRLPVHLVAERRIGIEGVRSGTAIGAVGGVGPTRIAGQVRVEGYAQGGVIFRDGHEGFADGSIRFTLPVAKRIDLGLGAWGGAQKGAARVDVGPTVGVAVPVAGRTFRISADWRQRVAGDVRPGSGPAVSLGIDF